MKKFKLFKDNVKKFLKKNKKLVNFAVKAFLVFKFLLDFLDLVLKLKDLCPWFSNLGHWFQTLTKLLNIEYNHLLAQGR